MLSCSVFLPLLCWFCCHNISLPVYPSPSLAQLINVNWWPHHLLSSKYSFTTLDLPRLCWSPKVDNMLLTFSKDIVKHIPYIMVTWLDLKQFLSIHSFKLFIVLAPHKYRAISTHQQLSWMFNCLIRLIAKTTLKQALCHSQEYEKNISVSSWHHMITIIQSTIIPSMVRWEKDQLPSALNNIYGQYVLNFISAENSNLVISPLHLGMIFALDIYVSLTLGGLMMPYGDKCLSQHWFR